MKDRAAALRGVHEQMGHRGLYATRRILLDRYWWPEVYDDVETWVRGCRECQIFSDRKITIPVTPSSPSQLFRKFYVDIMHMPRSMGFEYIVLARGEATTYVEGRTLRNPTMKAVARFLMEEIICRWGAIEEITTDNGPEFSSAVEELARRYSIMHIKISPYNLRAQGIVERGHHPFRRTLLKTCGNPAHWAQYFHHALWVDRAIVRKATGYSPFYLAHGYHPLLPIDAFQLTFAWNSRPMSTEDYVAERIRILAHRDEAEELALDRVRHSRWGYKERFEREHANTLFRGELLPGSLVLVRNSAIEKELDRKHKPRWLGPYIVVRKTKGGSYVLAQEDGVILQTRFAAFRVIPYHQREGLSFAVEDFLGPKWSENELELEEGDESKLESMNELRREVKRRQRWTRQSNSMSGEPLGRMPTSKNSDGIEQHSDEEEPIDVFDEAQSREFIGQRESDSRIISLPLILAPNEQKATSIDSKILENVLYPLLSRVDVDGQWL